MEAGGLTSLEPFDRRSILPWCDQWRSHSSRTEAGRCRWRHSLAHTRSPLPPGTTCRPHSCPPCSPPPRGPPPPPSSRRCPPGSPPRPAHVPEHTGISSGLDIYLVINVVVIEHRLDSTYLVYLVIHMSMSYIFQL